MRAIIDAAALGSGRGGDETLVRGLLAGLQAVAPPGDRFPVLVRDETLVPELAADDRFQPLAAPLASGVPHFALGLPLSLARMTRPDLVWTHTHAPVWSPGPVILCVTDVSFLRHPEHYPLTTRRRLSALVPRQARRAAAVHTISEFCRQEILEFLRLDEERVFVVPCAVEAPVPLSAEEEPAVDQWLADQGVREPFVLYLGNLHPRKNVARLIAAFTQARAEGALAGHQLVIAGARWWGDGDEQRAAQQAPEGSVVLVGRVNEPVRRRLLFQARLLAYVSLYEGFGLPPVEAMAAGTPVLASTAGSLPEVLGDAALWVDPLDQESIAGGLCRLATDDALRRRLIPLGRERASRYRPEATGNAVYTVLADIAGRSRQRVGR